MYKFLRKISRLSSIAALYASVACLILMTAIIIWQVFARYVLHAAPSRTEQASLLLMLWFLLFAAAAGVREGFHIRLTLLEENLSPSRRVLLRVFCHLVVFLFGTAMAWSGAELVVATWSHKIPTLGLPRGVAYLPIAGAGLLIALYAFEHMLLERRKETPDRLWP